MSKKSIFRSTTVLAVQRNKATAIGGDGQVSLGQTVIKKGTNKIRHLSDKNILAGFAGGAADSFTLFELFEKKIGQFQGSLGRAAVELARDWRTDRMLRRLEALLIVADKKEMFLVSGTGDVISPDDGILAVGSGANYALAAARALIKHTKLGARDIVQSALEIAGEICVYTNTNIQIKEIS